MKIPNEETRRQLDLIDAARLGWSLPVGGEQRIGDVIAGSFDGGTTRYHELTGIEDGSFILERTTKEKFIASAERKTDE